MKTIYQKALKGALLSAAMILSTLSGGVSAQEYPSKMVKLVVAFPAGGATDSAVRIIAERLQSKWGGNPVVVENKPGASGRVAMRQMVRENADGYAFVAITNSAINDELLQTGDDPSAKAFSSLTPVTTFFETPVVLAVDKSLGINTLAEYIQYAKDNPGKLSFGTSGQATSTHFFGELLKKEAHIDLIHVPFTGEGPNVTSLLGGHVTSSFVSIAGARKLLPTGKVVLLGVTSENRSPLLPELASFQEQGINGIDLDSWAGFLAPAGTPEPILEKFSAAVREVLAAPDVKSRFESLGLLAKGSTPAEISKRIASDRMYWEKAIAVTGIRLND